MQVCKTCLERYYSWPKFDETFSRSLGPCEVCFEPVLCIDAEKRRFAYKLENARVMWECAALQPGVGGDCRCGTITVDHEVVEVERDTMGGIRCVVTMPNTVAVNPEYCRSFRCAGEVVKAHLRSRARKVALSALKSAPGDGL